MHKLYDLKDKLIEELEAYSENGKYSKEDVEIIKYMASAVDHLCNIMQGMDEYSNAYMHEGNVSYARGGNRRGGGANQYGSYARNSRYPSEGYSRTADNMVMELRDIMQDAPNPTIRQEIERLVNKIEQM